MPIISGYGNFIRNLTERIVGRLNEISEFTCNTEYSIFPGQIMGEEDAEETTHPKITVGAKTINNLFPPEVFVILEEDSIEHACTWTDDHTITFTLAVVTDGSHPQISFWDGVALAGKVYDKFKEDSTINGACADSSIKTITYRDTRFEAGGSLNVATLSLVCRKMRLETS